MRLQVKHHLAPETINLFAIIVAMAVFGAGIFYAGASFNTGPRTTQFAVPSPVP